MIKKYINPEIAKWKSISKRPVVNLKKIEPLVQKIFDKVRSSGDSAVLQFTKNFDNVDLSNIKVKKSVLVNSKNKVSEEFKQALDVAKKNINKFHLSQITKPNIVETSDGVKCWQEKKPIEKIGIYIPGGSAPLFSTILMLAIPAKLAGCKQITLCTPPNKKGEVDPSILYTAMLCGVSDIFKVGGIQAIAAMTFGTETIPKVYKIFGPGNQYVTVAKQIATSYNVAIDLPAGPSELLVMADSTSNPSYIASDLLSQAEHGEDSQVILVTTHKELLNNVEDEINKQMDSLSRKKIILKSIKNSRFIFFENNSKAISFINQYAPEHYMICVKNEKLFIKSIKNAGSVFIGNYTPESAGDYASGTNHTLPTNGFSKQYSGVNIDSFLKAITFQKINKKGIKIIGPAIEVMADKEGLQAHKNSIKIRLNDL